MAALLGGSPAPAEPSAKLRRRILASVGVEQRSFGWAPFLAGATALCLCAALYFFGRERDFSQQLAALREQYRRQVIDLTHFQEMFAILNGPDTVVSSYGEKKPVPNGKVFLNPSMGVVLIASNLPQAPAGKAYEFWIIPKGKDAKPVRGGMFQSDSNGTAMHMERGPIDMSNTAALAVTMEVDTGVDAPTNTPVIVATVPALQ
jgi:hypothetical protein